MKLTTTHKLSVLIARYQEQAINLRHLDNFDVKIFGGFISIQFAFASWFAIHPIADIVVKFGLIAINFALLIVCFNILRSSRSVGVR